LFGKVLLGKKTAGVAQAMLAFYLSTSMHGLSTTDGNNFLC